jgi:cytochrome c5
MPTLLDHTVSGYKGMPPLGSCGDCGETEFTALIEFMARGRGAATP